MKFLNVTTIERYLFYDYSCIKVSCLIEPSLYQKIILLSWYEARIQYTPNIIFSFNSCSQETRDSEPLHFTRRILIICIWIRIKKSNLNAKSGTYQQFF